MEKNEPVPLHFVEIGRGVPIILLHGFPLSNVIWNPVAERLQDQARLILPDLRGHGGSPAPEGAYTMPELAGDVIALMDRLEIKEAIVVGHSMGGYISLAFARLYPHRLAGLGLVATQSMADTVERRQGRYQTAQEVRQRGVVGVAESMAPRLTAHAELVPLLKELILKTPPAGVIGALQGMAERPDYTEVLADLQIPTVVVTGDADALIPWERSQEMAARLPKSILVVIPGSGHVPMLEAPDQVADTLQSLINKTDLLKSYRTSRSVSKK